jgi:hypothetical protein
MTPPERSRPTRKARDNSGALAAVVACKTEIDSILERLTVLSAKHLNRTPDAIT